MAGGGIRVLHPQTFEPDPPAWTGGVGWVVHPVLPSHIGTWAGFTHTDANVCLTGRFYSASTVTHSCAALPVYYPLPLRTPHSPRLCTPP